MPHASPSAARSPALRSVATAFLRRRPLVVAPMFATVLIALARGPGPRSQIGAVALVASAALVFFSWEAWRGRAGQRAARQRLVTAQGLFVSLLLTVLGIGVASVVTGAAASPLVFMLFAPTVVGFAAFGRGRRSDLLLALALGLLGVLALWPAGFPFPPLSAGARCWLVAICAADALVLLRLGVAALTDAHAAASNAAASAGDDAVASAAARAAALEAMGAQVAHEVRNPLSAIRGLIEVLAEKPGDDRDRRRLEVMLGEVDRINGILTGYLALARPLDEVHPRPTDLGQLMREIAVLVEVRAERAAVALDVTCVPVTTAVDPHRLKEALLNLLLNAIDASSAGGRIGFHATASADQIEITVEDSGSGMDAQRLAAAGTRFSTGRAGGTGLGLALARQAIEQHRGTLVLRSEPGRGTLARVTLPLTPPPAAPS